jgi:nitrogen regulatory protein P-II 1
VKQVIAVVKPFLADKVLEALRLAPLEACTVREVKGYGRQKSYLDQYGDSEYSLAFLPKVEIQLWVDDARVDEVVDRKIFVLPAAVPVGV